MLPKKKANGQKTGKPNTDEIGEDDCYLTCAFTCMCGFMAWTALAAQDDFN
jgi:hypothetical protein